MSQSRRSTRVHPIQILIVDRHRAVCEGLASRLGAEADLVIVGQAVDGPAAIAAGTHLQPDVVLIEVSLLRGDGSETTRRPRRRRRYSPRPASPRPTASRKCPCCRLRRR
jgi:DNA-binding NarL/FixJ family response regulator